MLCKPVRAQYVREALILFLGVLIVRAFFFVCRWIRVVLRIKRICHQAFQWLIVRWQRTVFQPAGNPYPSCAVRMHDERLVTGKGVIAFGVFGRLVIRWLILSEVRSVVAGPLLPVGIPPHQPFALAPRRAVRSRRRTVIQDPAIAWPSVAPSMSVTAFWLALTSFIFIRRGHHAGVDPATTGG